MAAMIAALRTSPRRAEMILASKRMTTRGFPRSFTNSTIAAWRRRDVGSLGPLSASRRRASALARPPDDEPTRSKSAVSAPERPIPVLKLRRLEIAPPCLELLAVDLAARVAHPTSTTWVHLPVPVEAALLNERQQRVQRPA